MKLNASTVALFLTLGCTASDDETDGGGGESGDAGASDAGDGSEDGSGSSGNGDGGSGDDGGSSGDSGGSGMACEPGSDFEGPELRDCDLPGSCGSCMWEKACASFLFRCAHNAECVCAAECVAQAGVNAWESCLGQCGQTEVPPGFAEWLKGASDMCYDEGCGVLQDPPVDPNAPEDGSPDAGTEPDCAFDTNLSYDPCGEVLQLQSADGSFCARIERRNDGAGTDKNIQWTLLDVRAGPLGQVCHNDGAEDMCWFNSHHNYADWVHASCGGLHWEINIGQGCGEDMESASTFRLHVLENGPNAGACNPSSDGSCPVMTPIELFPIP